MRQMILLFLACSLLLYSLITHAAPPSPEIELQIQQGQISEPYEYTRQVDLGEPSEMLKELLRGHLRTEYRIVVIPFQYADYPAVTEPTYLDSLFFGDYFGTVRDYYSEITNGSLLLTTLNLPSEIGWLTLSGNLADYHGQPPRDEIMALADPIIDFSQYDNEDDGVVNGVILLHAGRGEESGGGSLQIWSHCGSFGSQLFLDGVHFWRYSAVPEYARTPRDQVIGVICHELGHQIMRWGDLYGDLGPNGPGRYCIMAYGCWNGSPAGILPAHPNLYYKIQNELLNVQLIDHNAMNMQFPEVRSYPVIPKLWMNGMDFYEYFIVENRQRTGYDAGLPEDGLLVYHINKGEYEPGIKRRSISLVPAGQIAGQTKFPYPGYTYDNRTLDSTSTPDSRDYNGNNTFVALRNISDTGLTMTADVYVENPNPPTVEITAPELGMSWFTGDTNRITWNSSGVFHDQKIEVRREGGPWEVVTDSVENKGFFDWVTDYPVANTANIRVSDAYAPETQDVSDDFSIIAPTLAITYPTAGTTWRVGDLAQILWESTGMDVWETVRIEIQRDGGRWTLIADDCANTGSFAWEVTRPVTMFGAIIRITSLNDHLVADSSALISITERALNLTYPNAFDYFAIGDQIRIAWEASGFTDPSVDLELTRNFGQIPTLWESIAEGVHTSDQMYDFEVRGELSTHARIRIKGHTQTTVADTSYENFTICDAHRLSVVAPNGGELWRTPESFEIQWTSENFLPSEPLRIELTRNYDPLGHSEWETLIESTPNTGSWPWTVTPPDSRRARVRISSFMHHDVAAISRDEFTIGVRSIDVQVPNGGEVWMPGDTVAISWRIEYMDAHDGAVGVYIHRTNPENPEQEWQTVNKIASIDQPCVWVVNEPTATDALIAVQSHEYPSVRDTSDNYFCIGNFSMEVTSPNGNESWIVGQEKEITWITDIPDEFVRIELDRRYPSGEWEVIDEHAINHGTYRWTVDGHASNSARLRISSMFTSAVSDTSDGSFSIAEYDLQVLTPEGGELWWLGEYYDITWSSVNFTNEDSLRVDIYRGRLGSLWEEVAVVPVLDGVYSWRATGWYSSVVKVRLTSLRHPEISDTSADFTTNYPQLTIIAPNGGENLTVGDVYRVEWTQNYDPSADTVSLALSRNHPYGGWETLVQNIPNVGHWDWTVTGPPADSARVEIFSTVMYWPKDISDTIFTIDNSLRLIEPNELTVWRVGDREHITWDGELSNPMSHVRPLEVKIELCRDYSSAHLPRWELIADRVPNYGDYVWTVTRPGGRSARLRVSQIGQPENCALSDGTFRILEIFTIFRINNPLEDDPDAVAFQFGSLTPPQILKSLSIKGTGELPENTRITLANRLNDDGTVDCIYDRAVNPEERTSNGCELRLLGDDVPQIGTETSELYVFISNLTNASERSAGEPAGSRAAQQPFEVEIQTVYAGNPELTLQVAGKDIILCWKMRGAAMYDIFRADAPDTSGERIATVAQSEFIDREVLKTETANGFYYVMPHAQTITPEIQLNAGSIDRERN